MKVFQKNFGGTRCIGVQTLPVRLMDLQWSREQNWDQFGSGKHSIFTNFPKVLEGQNNKGFLQKTR